MFVATKVHVNTVKAHSIVVCEVRMFGDMFVLGGGVRVCDVCSVCACFCSCRPSLMLENSSHNVKW